MIQNNHSAETILQCCTLRSNTKDVKRPRITKKRKLLKRSEDDQYLKVTAFTYWRS